LTEEIVGKDDKIQKFYASGKREIIFPNGVRRLVWQDGYSIIYFANNDIKQVFPEQAKTVYFFAKVGTTQSTFKDGMQAFRFANN
jgi:centromere protein J